MRFLTLLPLLMLAACGQADDGVVARQDDSVERFYSGCARPGEFRTAAELPAIPPSFDEDMR